MRLTGSIRSGFTFVLLLAGLTFVIAASVVEPTSDWTCATLVTKDVIPGVVWTRLNCTGSTDYGKVGPMVFNTIHAALNTPGLRLVPGVADPSLHLQSVDKMAMTQVPHAIAGVNGGYFWRLDRSDFFDDVCFFKSRSDAEQPASEDHPNYGVGDGVTIIDGKWMSSNCDCLGYARPAVILINQTDVSQTNIVVMDRAGKPPSATQFALGAGPNLVSVGPDGRTYVDIPTGDHNVNIWEHSSNTAIGLSWTAADKSDMSVVFVVADGHDGCKDEDVTCGIAAHKMAVFMKDHIGAKLAMECDQGGSSTMWIDGQGIVSNPGSGARAVYNGLFLTYQP